MKARTVLALLLVPLGTCVFNVRLALADETRVAGSAMTVNASAGWKKLRASARETRWEVVWTWNGPQLDRITLIGGLPDGEAIASRRSPAERQVPVFRADMTTQDLASMVEVSYRVNGVTVFDLESVEPLEFLGGPGVRLRYGYVSGIVFAKKGSCVMRVVDGRLYAVKLESVAGNSFDAVLSEFDRLVASARLGDRARGAIE